MTSFSGGQGRGLLFSSSFRARDNENAGETQPRQLNTSPPPPYLPRERETWNRPAPEAQSREVQELQTRIAEMQEREQRTREENYRMRDDLERLIRRDRPAPERADDRRIQKTVHNWPFKFRGEKDTTSLNVFLDRVETFARSEGISDATLLSSIKHLLQEDAIDWYSRATSQNLLRTWDQFKREIRREFLPSGYSQIPAFDFKEGRNPLRNDEKFFLVKKNMNENYAAIVTAARPRSLEEMVEVCSGYDETRMLLNRQRRIPIPHSALLEPNFATPVTTSRPPPIQHHQQPERFNRVHAVEVEKGAFEHEAAEEGPEDNWQHNIDELVEQVNALKLNIGRRSARPSFAARDERQPRPTVRHNRTEADVLRSARRYTRDAQSPAQQQRPQTASYQTRLLQQQQEQPLRAQGWQARQWMPSSDQSDNNRRSQRLLPEPARQREDRQIQQEEAPNGQRIAMLCWNCDEEGHRFMDCPKPQAILFCYRCGRKGYSLRSCFTCRMDAVNYQAENQHDNRPHAVISVLGKELTALLDSGANCSLLGGRRVELAEECGLQKGTVSGGIKTADGTRHSIANFVFSPIVFNNRNEVLPVLLVSSIPDCIILGMNFWDKFGVKAVCCTFEAKQEDQISEEQEMKQLSPEQQRRLEQAIQKFPKAVDGRLGRTKLYEHRIDVGNAPPRKQRHYPISPYVLQEVNREIDRMIALDVIEEAQFSPWNNPLVAIKKKTGQYRVCLDARHLNSVMVNEGYPIPQIAAITNNLRSSKYISSIDLKDAIWQLPLHPGSRQLTAFTVPSRGHFQFNVVPFELCTASQALARLMTHLFADLEPLVFHYLDDIIICSETFEEHIALLEEVARRLRQANLTISSEKSKFCRKNEEKIQAIEQFPTPTTRKEVQRFLGVCNWYRRFIAGFSQLAAPLTNLTSGKTKFRWNPIAEEAFLKLKAALVSAPVLAMPDYSKPFAIACDASDTAIGAVLTQEINGEEHPISYFSQKLSASERKYSVTERECLAVIRAIEKFRGYVEGIRFVVHCDHAALSYLKSMKNPTALMSRWLLRLNAFDFEIRYRKGFINVVPDALSRTVAEAVFTVDQVLDPWYRKLVDRVKSEGDKFPDFRIANDTLFKNCRCKDEVGAVYHKWKQVVPKEERFQLIRRFHDEPAAAHLGFYKTWHKLQAHYYWPQMQQEIHDYVMNCATCKACKAPGKRMMPQMGNPKPAKTPWEMISVDFVGPLTRSKRGNTVLLVVVDWVSKYVIVKPMRAADSQKMVEFLEEEVCLKFSRSRLILSDNGKQFESMVFKSWLAKHKIGHMKTVFYCPQVNNAERVNRVVVTCIRALLDGGHREWDEKLPAITAAINAARHEATGVSPHEANFGRNLLLHTDLYTQQELNTPEDPKVAQDLRLSAIRRIQKLIIERIKNSHQRAKQRYNLRTRSVAFKVGDLVWRRSFILSSKADQINSKLEPKFVSAIVKEIIGTNLYVLEDVLSGKKGRFHAKDIKAD
ncbi:uncharacterized protein LOC134290601 [Aedes albopictus]|uniref:RNA-directed DNA polymerase n=1 Tax=Aedes albopictus TaxID=7160 RepID=A0ABM1XJU0_AEDAL